MVRRAHHIHSPITVRPVCFVRPVRRKKIKMTSPELFEYPKQPLRRLSRLERRAAYRAMRFYLEASPENMLNGRELDALPSALEKLKPVRRRKHK